MVGEVAGQQRPVRAGHASHRGDPLVGLTRHAVHPLEQSQLAGRVGVEPGHRQVLALPPPGGGVEGFMAARRAGHGAHRLPLADQPIPQLQVPGGHRLIRLADPSADRTPPISNGSAGGNAARRDRAVPRFGRRGRLRRGRVGALVGVQRTVQSGASDLEVRGDRGHRLTPAAPGHRDREGVAVQGWGSTTLAALGLGGGQAVEGAFPDEVAFHYVDKLVVSRGHVAILWIKVPLARR